ncbi:MAG: hypothetical protein QOC66_7 [Pseudonocardiales bacterium]|nr:hypothetical protein [Pseudonocardiales bacterium]
MRPEVQVLPGPLHDAAPIRLGRRRSDEEVRVNKPLLLAAIAAAMAAVAARRRQAQADAATLWREATSDASK